MQVQCPGCNKAILVPDERAGQVAACPACGGQMQLPSAGPAPTGLSAPVGAAKRCPFCSEQIQADAIKCHHCGSFLDGRPADEPQRDGPPWERRTEIGFWPALFQTVQGALIRPGQIFQGARLEGYGPAIGYCTLCGSFGLVVAMLFQSMIMALVIGGRAGGGAMTLAMVAGMVAAAVVLGPVAIICGMFVFAGLVHLTLMIIGAANRPFVTTFRTVAYGYGSAQLFTAIPICGQYITLGWGVVASIIGLAKMQRISYGKAAAAVLAPMGLGLAVGVAVGIAVAMAEAHK